MERLNYNQLYYFYIVAKEGSIKAASEKLHLTQPTISGQLKVLEESLGFQLFERKHRKLELNSFGRDVLKKAEKIFILGDDLVSSLPNRESHFRNNIRVGTLSTLPNSLVHDFTLKAWKDETISLHIVHGQITELIRLLNQDKLDLILSDSPYGTSKKFKSIHLGTHKLVAAGPQELRHARKNFPNSLNGLPYLSLNKNGQLQQEIDYFFQINNIRPDNLGSVDDDTFIRMVAEKGLSFVVLPELSIRELLREKRLFKLGEIKEISLSCWVITPNSSSQRVIIRRLINDFLVKKRQRK